MEENKKPVDPNAHLAKINGGPQNEGKINTEIKDPNAHLAKATGNDVEKEKSESQTIPTHMIDEKAEGEGHPTHLGGIKLENAEEEEEEKK